MEHDGRGMTDHGERHVFAWDMTVRPALPPADPSPSCPREHVFLNTRCIGSRCGVCGRTVCRRSSSRQTMGKAEAHSIVPLPWWCWSGVMT